MGLFQRNVFTQDTPLYEVVDTSERQSSSLIDRTLLIVGLGNPGKKYDGTRHNIGFASIDEFAANNEFEAWKSKKDMYCEISTKIIGSTKVILIKPTTFMNHSGQATQAVQKYYKLSNKDTSVVYDELAIPFGQIRTRKGGGSAGHNGIKSLITHCEDDFHRIRIGINTEIADKAKSEDFVLAKFNKKEIEAIPKIIKEVEDLLQGFIGLGSLIPETRKIEI